MNENKGLSRGQWLALTAAFLGWMFDGFEMGLFPIIARPALMDLIGKTAEALNAIDPKKYIDSQVGFWNGWVTACFLFGAALGGFLFGWMGDKIGRVRAMLISILVYSVFTTANYFVTAPWQMAMFRFIAALGMGGEWALGIALVVECWPDRFRPLMAGIIGAAANVGFLLIAAVGYMIPVHQDSWRWMTLCALVPAAVMTVIILFVEESAKWKAAVKIKKVNPIVEIFAPAMLGKTFGAIAISAVPVIVTWGAVSGWLPLWADMLGGKDNPHAKASAQIAISIGAIIGCIGGGLMGGRIGRRPAYFILCVLSLIVCSYQFRYLSVYNGWFFFVTILNGLTSAAFYGLLPLYLPELFPTRIRATGQGMTFNFGRILAGFGALYMGGLVQTLGGNIASAAAKISLVYVIGMVIIWLMPETKGKPLPE